jgi:hypothetical protein
MFDTDARGWMRSLWAKPFIQEENIPAAIPYHHHQQQQSCLVDQDITFFIRLAISLVIEISRVSSLLENN